MKKYEIETLFTPIMEKLRELNKEQGKAVVDYLIDNFELTSLRLDGDKDKIYSEMTELIQEQLFTYKAIEDLHIASDLAGLIMTKFMAALSLNSSIVSEEEINSAAFEHEKDTENSFRNEESFRCGALWYRDKSASSIVYPSEESQLHKMLWLPEDTEQHPDYDKAVFQFIKENNDAVKVLETHLAGRTLPFHIHAKVISAMVQYLNLKWKQSLNSSRESEPSIENTTLSANEIRRKSEIIAGNYNPTTNSDKLRDMISELHELWYLNTIKHK